ncbi:MAG: hypothetical protein ACI8P3_000917 [Saprospiraceae bacterium]|jgi:uncharacterized protein YdeI (YjbR/CyaY-like superfamily)
MLKVRFFKTQSDLRKWFEKNHLAADELFLGYYKKATKKPSVDWSESVDEAVCFGWIDGIRRKIDEESYSIRFTPRRAKSHWSAVNIEKVKLLTAAGLMYPTGVEAFKKMDPKNSEQIKVVLDKNYENQIKAIKKAWVFYEKLAPSFKKSSIYWVMSAKQEATRMKRLQILIESSENGLKIPMLRTNK